MKRQYFLKDKKAQIYKEITLGIDASGFRITGYVPLGKTPFWCYTKQTSQELRQISAALGEIEERLFVFNYLDDAGTGDFILYRDKWYQITRADTADDYRGELFIYVTLSGRLGIPPRDQFLPYGTPVVKDWEERI